MILTFIAFMGCAGTTPAGKLPAGGTRADISFLGGEVEDAELVALQDDTLYALGDSLVAIPVGGLRTVELKNIADRSWMSRVVFAQLLPAALLMFTESQSGQQFAVIIGGAGVGTWAAWEFSTPQSIFEFPLAEAEGQDLALHFRFPYGVERSRLMQISALARGGKP